MACQGALSTRHLVGERKSYWQTYSLVVKTHACNNVIKSFITADLHRLFLTLACVPWVMERRREAERDRRGELKGDDSAEEQVSLSPPLK